MIFDEGSLPVRISSHELFAGFSFPCLLVQGRDRVALVGIQPGSTLYNKAERGKHPSILSTVPTPRAARARAEAAGLWLWLAAEVVIQWEVF